MHTRAQSQQKMCKCKEESAMTKRQSNDSEKVLKSLSNTLKVWSRSFRVVMCFRNAWCAGRGI
jgi:hypothetical protein